MFCRNTCQKWQYLSLVRCFICEIRVILSDNKSLMNLTAASPVHRHTGSAVDTPCVVWEGVQSSAVITVTALTVFNTGVAGCSNTRVLNCGKLLLGSAGFWHYRSGNRERTRGFVQRVAKEPDTSPGTGLKTFFKFRVCQSVHHHTFNWINQPDAATSQVYYLSFKYSSTCFGHPHAHHQELQQLQ
jgi:hypothetical protein